MSRITRVDYAFVESAPTVLEPGTIYVSTKHRAIIHLCLCGCGEKVLLNLDPKAWSFNFDGRSISVYDSVGNVGIPCRSHYLIRHNKVTWLAPLIGVDPVAALERARATTPAKKPSEEGWFAQWLPRKRRDRVKR